VATVTKDKIPEIVVYSPYQIDSYKADNKDFSPHMLDIIFGTRRPAFINAYNINKVTLFAVKQVISDTFKDLRRNKCLTNILNHFDVKN
jgi:hypothetical protein